MTANAQRMWDRLGAIAYGGDYNPEQWPQNIWHEDAALMKEAGVNMVSLNIFGWASIQTTPETWDFGWLDTVMDILHAAGVSVCLATGTASPPPWFSRMNPQTLPVTADGVRLSPGGRQHYCPSSPIYREAAAQLARKMAQRYAEHPALASWHVNNEYGGHVLNCYCDVSAADFRSWLRNRYGTLDALNAAWSTTFWSQRYSEWDEILPPRTAPTFANPAQQLDYSRFGSAALIQCYRAEADELRAITPDIPLTTNTYTKWSLDTFSWAGEMDIVSFDSYTDPRFPDTTMSAGIAFDIMRSARHGEPWLLLEQAPSAVNWRDVNVPKQDGRYRLGCFQAVAHGANGVMSFQWRASLGGAEKFHSALVPHVGTDARIWRDSKTVGSELAALGAELPQTRVHNDVALSFSWDSWWALDLDARPSALVDLPSQLRTWYEPLWRSGVAADVVPPDRDLSGYKLVILPNLYAVSDAQLANLERYVRGGGTLVISYFSGVVDDNDRVRSGNRPYAFASLTGVRVEEFWPLQPGFTADVHFGDGVTSHGSMWTEILQVDDTTDILARFGSTDVAGIPAVTRNQVGDGAVYYTATTLDPAGTAHLMSEIRRNSGVEALVSESSQGVEAVRRTGIGIEYLFVLNHADTPGWATLLNPGIDQLTGDKLAGRVQIPPRDLIIVRSVTADLDTETA